LNRRHMDYDSTALTPELPRHPYDLKNQMSLYKDNEETTRIFLIS
jgi:hypothetical protein